MRQWWVWLSEWKTEVAGCSVGDLEESQRFIKHFYEIRCAKMHRRHILVSNHTNSTAASKMQCFVFCRITVAFYSIISLLFSHYQICFVFVLFSCTEVIFFFFYWVPSSECYAKKKTRKKKGPNKTLQWNWQTRCLFLHFLKKFCCLMVKNPSGIVSRVLLCSC